MAIARNASSPARVTTTTAPLNNDSGTTAAFSPPADSWLFCSFGGNQQVSPATTTFNTPTNTGTALTWSQVANVVNAGGGGAVVWRAYNLNAQTGITVTASASYSLGGSPLNGQSAAFWVDVWTGCKTTQTGAAASTSTSATQTNNPSVTTTAGGSRVALVGLDWAAAGNPSSSDTIDGGTVAASTSFGLAYKAADSGAAGSVSVNFVNGGASPINSFVAYEILAAPAATGIPVLSAAAVSSITASTATPVVTLSF